MHLVITIDTEEDNWGDYSSESFSIENIKKIPSLQKIFDEFNIIPTYLVTYPVATNKVSVNILKEIHQQGKCEIGMHCHPWSTPPFEEKRNSHNSMLCNLPYELQYKKMSVLHEVIEKNIGVTAKSFRAGRWGYNETVSKVIRSLDYLIDTSVTPFMDWTAYHGPDYSCMTPEPFRFNEPEIFKNSEHGKLLEIPATIGYLQSDFNLCNIMERYLTYGLCKRLRLKGILDAMRLLNKVWLSPEGSDSGQMIQLTKVLLRKNYKIINLFFHTTSLQAGLSYCVKTKEDEVRISNNLKEYFTYTKENGIKSISLSDAKNII